MFQIPPTVWKMWTLEQNILAHLNVCTSIFKERLLGCFHMSRTSTYYERREHIYVRYELDSINYDTLALQDWIFRHDRSLALFSTIVPALVCLFLQYGFLQFATKTCNIWFFVRSTLVTLFLAMTVLSILFARRCMAWAFIFSFDLFSRAACSFSSRFLLSLAVLSLALFSVAVFGSLVFCHYLGTPTSCAPSI
jgi:hypothetical protein